MSLTWMTMQLPFPIFPHLRTTASHNKVQLILQCFNFGSGNKKARLHRTKMRKRILQIVFDLVFQELKRTFVLSLPASGNVNSRKFVVL